MERIQSSPQQSLSSQPTELVVVEHCPLMQVVELLIELECELDEYDEREVSVLVVWAPSPTVLTLSSDQRTMRPRISIGVRPSAGSVQAMDTCPSCHWTLTPS